MQFPDEMFPLIYLSRRNLLTLLSKLDRAANGELTTCAIIKIQHPSADYQQTLEQVIVIAVDDEAYYTAQNRTAGAVHPVEEDRLPRPLTGNEMSWN